MSGTTQDKFPPLDLLPTQMADDEEEDEESAAYFQSVAGDDLVGAPPSYSAISLGESTLSQESMLYTPTKRCSIGLHEVFYFSNS